MNKDELQLRKELSVSAEWKEIRRILLDFCSIRSGNDEFCTTILRGMLYTVKVVDDWEQDYYKAIEKVKKEKGEYDG